jgi:uncharacterized Zn finger protein (UPF0148 family)
MDANYKVKKGLLNGAPSVHFACSHCASSLVFDLADAGNVEPCPSCGMKLPVPGVAEKEAAESAAKAKAESDARNRDEKKRQQQAAEAARLVENARRRAEERARTAPQASAASSANSSSGLMFDVQAIDPRTGVESWIQVGAATADEARARVQGAGMTIGAVRLRGVESEGVRTSPRVGLQGVTQGVVCPICNSVMVPSGRGMHSGTEKLTCIFLLMFGLLPGVLFYVVTDMKPYCRQCRRRV